MLKEIQRLVIFLLFAIALVLPFPAEQAQAVSLAQKDQKEKKEKKPSQPGKPILWRDPGAVEKLDLIGGSTGRAKAPKPPFTFVEESLSGSNPKIRVTDANGVTWTAKFGSEVNAETFTTRMVWAVGYFVEPAYFVPSGRILNVGNLTRAKKHVKENGDFFEARFEMQREKGVKKLEDEESWGWLNNPFAGSKELNGLKVMAMLLSNWDNKDVRDVKRGSNTAIFRTPTDAGIEDRYLVGDWGGSMGKWGGFLAREKWDCKGYAGQSKDFVKGVRGQFIEFGYSGQHTSDFKSDIRVSDVKWLMQYLGRISDSQIRDALLTSGAGREEAECFSHAIRERIKQLQEVAH
ncbi:MAG TPA: hypothetical protein VGB07_29110 [Blastocatellia bacterium]